MAKTILLIDDSETSLFLIKSILDEHDDLDYILETNSAKALQVLKNQYVDLIFLDLMMPEIDGFQFLKYVKSDSQLSSIPIFIITALDDPQARGQTQKLGAAEFFRKPLNISNIENKILAYLE